MRTCKRCADPMAWLGGKSNKWICRRCYSERAKARRDVGVSNPVVVEGAIPKLRALFAQDSGALVDLANLYGIGG